VTGSTARRVRPAVRGRGLGRGYVILPEAGRYKPIREHDAKTLARDLTGHLAHRAGTEYASVAGPVLAFTGRLREQRAEQIMVLIPVATPDPAALPLPARSSGPNARHRAGQPSRHRHRTCRGLAPSA